MGRDRMKLTPGFFSIAFGVFLLVLSGASGFYIPKGSSETIDLAQAEMTAATPEADVPASAAQESPASILASASDASIPTVIATQIPMATTTPSPTAPPSPTPTATATAAPTATPAPTSAPSRRVHVVESGETLLEIAENYGVSVDALMEANGIDDADTLAVGDELVILRH